MNYTPRIGRRYGKLTVVAKVANEKYKCVCDCGGEKVANWKNLERGHTKSCGCLRGTVAPPAERNHSAPGVKRHPLYETWRTMIRRCYDPGSKRFGDYGAAGVTVCQEWREDFWAFIAHVGDRPSPFHSLDRKDGTKGYEPENVRWATALEQAANKKSTAVVYLNGELMSRAAATRRLGTNPKPLAGLSPAHAVARDVVNHRLFLKQATGEVVDWGKALNNLDRAVTLLKLENHTTS